MRGVVPNRYRGRPQRAPLITPAVTPATSPIATPTTVIPGLDPGTHDFLATWVEKAWVAGTSPAMTGRVGRGVVPNRYRGRPQRAPLTTPRHSATTPIATPTAVIPGLDPGTHAFLATRVEKAWVAGSSPAMTGRVGRGVASNRYRGRPQRAPLITPTVTR